MQKDITGSNILVLRASFCLMGFSVAASFAADNFYDYNRSLNYAGFVAFLAIIGLLGKIIELNNQKELNTYCKIAIFSLIAPFLVLYSDSVFMSVLNTGIVLGSFYGFIEKISNRKNSNKT